MKNLVAQTIFMKNQAETENHEWEQVWQFCVESRQWILNDSKLLPQPQGGFVLISKHFSEV